MAAPLIRELPQLTPAIAYRFCSVAELQREKRVTRFVDELRDEISAVLVGGEIYVVSSICPHFGGILEVNEKRCEFRCIWHGWRFDIPTGKCKTYALKTSVRHYEFEITEDGFVEVISE